MGDSPSLSFVPAFDEPYDEGIFEQFAEFAWVVTSLKIDRLIEFIQPTGVVATKAPVH